MTPCSLTRRQLDFRMKLAKEFAATPSEPVAHVSRKSLCKRAKFLENTKKWKKIDGVK